MGRLGGTVSAAAPPRREAEMTRLAYEISERAMRSREGASGMSATAIRAVLDPHEALVRDCAEGRLTFGEFLGACGDFPRGYGLSGASLPVMAAILLVTLGRAVAIYPLCALFARSRLKVEFRHQHVLFWGGLRGALALALALAVPEELPRHDAIITITFAVVAFSVFAQGLTIPSLLRRLRQID